MGYYIDLETISITDYKSKLETAYLPPSRMILKERRDERFARFTDIGIKNVRELLLFLKKRDKFTELSKIDCLSGNYLTILLRELNSILPKPTRIKDFKGISEGTVSRLEEIGIKNTLKLYDRIKDAKSRKELAETLGIDESEILFLAKLTDLSRIRWVGATFARMLYDLGIDTVEKSAIADPVDLHEKINRLNKERKYFKGHIGLNDMKIFVDTAKEIPVEVVF